MIPIQKLLSRILHDPEFGNADFSVGVYDRIKNKTIPFNLNNWELQNSGFSVKLTHDNEELTIPCHRIRELYRNGELIWKRPSLPK
jgi:uncharacterized protein (UPF0248 family)